MSMRREGWGLVALPKWWEGPHNIKPNDHYLMGWFFEYRVHAQRHAEQFWHAPWKKLYRQGLRAVRVTLLPTTWIEGDA